MAEKLTHKFRSIKLLATDFDGIHTDGKVLFREDGKESVVCSRRDSLGINMLKNAGITVIVISKEENPVVTARCKKIGVEYVQSVEDGIGKAKILLDYMKEHGFTQEQVVFMGDDVNDISAMKVAGVAITVADGHKKVKEAADYVTSRNGGDHAIREVAEAILAAQGHPIEY